MAENTGDSSKLNEFFNGVAEFIGNTYKTAGSKISGAVEDIYSGITGYDTKKAYFSVVDDNGEESEYDLSSGGKIYKTPTGYSSQRGYAYITPGADGKVVLNVSKSVSESDWFKKNFTDNDTFKKILSAYNANPNSSTTVSTTDEDGNTKNVTLSEAVSQYNEALNKYAKNYEGMSSLRDYYKNNTGLNLTDDQILMSQNITTQKNDKNSETKIINLPDSWLSIYDFSKLSSWDADTKTVSAKDFYDVLNLDEDGSINEEAWNAMRDATNAEIANAYSGSVASNLNTEDPDAIKYAGDKLAKAVAAAQILNDAKPDVSLGHNVLIFNQSVAETFVSQMMNTYGNIADWFQGFGVSMTESDNPVVSSVGKGLVNFDAIVKSPNTAIAAYIGAVFDDIKDGNLSYDNAGEYMLEVKGALEELWKAEHGEILWSEMETPFLNGFSSQEVKETLEADVDYLSEISKVATAGKTVGSLLELAAEVWLTEKVGTGVGSIVTSGTSLAGKGLARIFPALNGTAKTRLGVSMLNIASHTPKVIGFGANMLTQGFMDTIESDYSYVWRDILRDETVSDDDKKALINAYWTNTTINFVGELGGRGLETYLKGTKTGRAVNARLQQAAAAASLPAQRGKIIVAKLINGIVDAKAPSKAAMDALNKEALSFGVNSLNSYNVKLAEVDYAATKQIVKAKKGNEYVDALTGETIKAETKTKAIETAVSNRIRYQNMIDRINKGVQAEMQEIMADESIKLAHNDNIDAATKVKEIEAKSGITSAASSKEFGQFSQGSSDYLAHKKSLDYLTRKASKLAEAGKQLDEADALLMGQLQKAVSAFEGSNSRELVEALNNYYTANMAFNKALTDWEYKHGLLAKDVYESLKATGYFGSDDEFYVHTIALKDNGNLYTEQYADAMENYAASYNRRAMGSYRVGTDYKTDYHIAKTFSEDIHYLDPELTNFARVAAMAQAYQGKEWGKALLGTGVPIKEVDTTGKVTERSQIKSAFDAYENASTAAVNDLMHSDLSQLELGASFYEQYNLTGRINKLEKAELSQLGIKDSTQTSNSVKVLNDTQVKQNISNIAGAPNYVRVNSYAELDDVIANMPNEEMRNKARDMMRKQGLSYDKASKSKAKEIIDAQKKLRKEAAALEKAGKTEEAAALTAQADSMKAPRELSDKQKAVKAWNDAIKNTTMVNDLNRMWLQDAIKTEDKVPEEVMAAIKGQITEARMAEWGLSDHIAAEKVEFNPVAKKKRDRFLKRREALDSLKELLKLRGEGLDPFTQGCRSFVDDIVSNTKRNLEVNRAAQAILKQAADQGIDPDLVAEYMALNALLKQSADGSVALRKDVNAAIDDKMSYQYRRISAEGQLATGIQLEATKAIQDISENEIISQWAEAQKKLVDAGGDAFIDMEKNFAYVKKEMETFVGEFHSQNVIPILDSDGVKRFYEVSPLVSDIYLNRPLATYGAISEFFNKVSRISRLSNTGLNFRSVMNQCFRDPINAYIMGGMIRGIKANQEEMTRLFGPQLVAHLEEEMSSSAWAKFTENGAISGAELEKKAANYIVNETGVDTFVAGETEQALYNRRKKDLRSALSGENAKNINGWQNAYKSVKQSLLDSLQKISPGIAVNNLRETWLRKGTYNQAFADALKQGKTVAQAKNIAEFVSRNATTNFSRTFMWGNSIVNAVPFLGAAINGTASFWRLVQVDPIGIFTRFTTAGLAMMSLVGQSLTTKKNRDVYNNVPEYIKSENLVFVVDGELFKIPIPQELAGFLSPFRQTVEKSYPGTNASNHEWFEILANDLMEISPISLDGFETLDEINLDGDPTIFDRMSRESSALVSQLAPPIIKSIYMANVGVDPYTGNPIDREYKTFDSDGNLILMDNTESAFSQWLSSKARDNNIDVSPSMAQAITESAIGTGLMTIADSVMGLFQGNPEKALEEQLKSAAKSVNVSNYSDPYLTEFKATIKELEDEKNSLLAADGDLALLSSQLSQLKSTDSNYETKKRNLTQQWMQKTEDYRQKVLKTVQTYNNHYGSKYTAQQFASVVNLLTFQNSTLIPQDALQSEQLSELFYSARQQAYQTMIDMGFDSPNDWSLFGVARRNKNTGEIYVQYSSPTAILNMDNAAFGAGGVYAAELEQALKAAGLDKNTRYQAYAEAKAQGSAAVKQFKKEWNAKAANAIAGVMDKYGAENVIGSNDAVSLLNEYLYVNSNMSYKVKDYLEEVFGKGE